MAISVVTITYKLTCARGARKNGETYHVVYIAALWQDSNGQKQRRSDQTLKRRTSLAASKQAENMCKRHAKANSDEAILVWQ